MAEARALLDVGQARPDPAHLARDAFVCGNGFLEFKPALSGMQLLQPDHTERTSEEEIVAYDPFGGSSRHLSVDRGLHLRGNA